MNKFNFKNIGGRFYIEYDAELQTLSSIVKNAGISEKRVKRYLWFFEYDIDGADNLYIKNEWGAIDFVDKMNWRLINDINKSNV